jgi:hypothetical protein
MKINFKNFYLKVIKFMNLSGIFRFILVFTFKKNNIILLISIYLEISHQLSKTEDFIKNEPVFKKHAFF